MPRPCSIGAIAAMTTERVIGTNNSIPWHYPEDFKRFKRITLNSIIIMGRKTWESIGCKPLPQRRNIVVSRNAVKNIEHYASIQSAMTACANASLDIWFIGGGQIYAGALSYCTRLDITTVPNYIEPADTILFPEIDLHVWSAGKSVPLAADPRLSVQRYTRK